MKIIRTIAAKKNVMKSSGANIRAQKLFMDAASEKSSVQIIGCWDKPEGEIGC